MDTTDSPMRPFQRTAKLVATGSTLALGVVCFLAVSSQQQQPMISPNLHGTDVASVHGITEMEHRDLAKKGRIVGGQESKKGQFPFMVSLRNGDKDWSWATCGGSLISPSIVLTAAHCVGSIVMADYNRHKQDDPLSTDGVTGVLRQYVDPEDVIAHEEYSHTTLDYDFALVRLPEPYKNPNLVKLNEESALPKEADRPRVIGWGRTEYNGSPSSIQKYADLDYVGQTDCLKRFGNNYITDQMLCAYSEGTDACQGDSGGPLISVDSDLNEVQVGVVSWGAGCASKYPGVYSRVHTAIDWINSKVCEGSNALAPQDCEGGVIKGLSGSASSGPGDSSNAADISETDGEARDKEDSEAEGKSNVAAADDSEDESEEETPAASDCKDDVKFKTRRGRKKTCEYVAKSTATRCKLYKNNCKATCGLCDAS